MSDWWEATGPSYFAHVTKARIAEAVGEASGAEEAKRVSDLKKPDAIAAASTAVAGKRRLPALQRTPNL
jgi:ParB family chromosome partitioning protein